MRVAALIFGLVAMPAVAAPTSLALFPGIYTNEEDVYFAKEAGKTPPRATAIEIVREGNSLRLRAIDAYGKPLEAGHVMAVAGMGLKIGACGMPFRAEKAALIALPRTGTCHNESVMQRIGAEGITLGFPDGAKTLLRRARAVTCWGSVPRAVKKADGSEDWLFVPGLKLHDQGGRAAFGGGESGAAPVILRMRNVIWPTGTNKPSLVLYVHTPDAPDKAVAYSWADPDAKRIGINLRWMQASCSINNLQGAT